MVLTSFIKLIKKTRKENPDAMIIIERSPETSRTVFCKMLHDDGFITDMEYDIYKDLYDTIIDDCEATIMIYVHVEPEICLERIKKRNRKGEDGIDIKYLEKLDKYHKEMIANSNAKIIVK